MNIPGFLSADGALYFTEPIILRDSDVFTSTSTEELEEIRSDPGGLETSGGRIEVANLTESPTGQRSVGLFIGQLHKHRIFSSRTFHREIENEVGKRGRNLTNGDQW